MKRRVKKCSVVSSLVALLLVSACSGSEPSLVQKPFASATPAGSLLPHLSTISVVGSTLDPINGDQNPYGLAIAPVTAGLVTAGDLIICNFNDGPTNTQGNGTTIVGLHPAIGSTAYRIAQGRPLLGCNALSIAPNGDIWTADFNANDNAIYSPGGTLVAALPASTTYPWSKPFGEIFAAGPAGATSFFVSNAAGGTVDRVAISNGAISGVTVIATGFSINNGPPGSILGPSGLTYDGSSDTLYVVDGNANSVSAIANASTIAAPSAASVRVIAQGAPLNGPISAALLPNGNLIVGNTLDPAGTNLMIEVSPTAGILATKNVDTGAGGAIFGIVASGTVAAPKVYFNDDNANAVEELTP